MNYSVQCPHWHELYPHWVLAQCTSSSSSSTSSTRSTSMQLVHNELQGAVSPLPLVVRVTPLPGWCGTSSHPGMRSGNLKKYEIDNISQTVNFEPDSNRFPGKFLKVDLSHSGIGLLIGCEQKMHDFDSTFFYFWWVTDEAFQFLKLFAKRLLHWLQCWGCVSVFEMSQSIFTKIKRLKCETNYM